MDLLTDSSSMNALHSGTVWKHVSTPSSTSDELLAQFYGLTTLSSILGPVQSQNRHQGNLMRQQRSRPIWHSFLDCLSWLGDFDTGGKTVTSIAAEYTPEGVRFWVTANTGPRQKAVNHLVWVLERLRHVQTLSGYDQRQTEEEIFCRSIVLSHKKIRFYGGRLSQYVRRVASAIDVPRLDSGETLLLPV